MKFLKTLASFLIFIIRYRHKINVNKKIKNILLDDVYLLGSGPSMKGLKLSSLKNKNCIFLNSFYKHPDFLEISTSDIDNKYYVIAPIHPPQDELVWAKWLKEIEAMTPKNVVMILGLNYRSTNIKNIVVKYKLFNKHKVFYYYAGNYSGLVTEKSINPTKNLLASETVSLYGIYLSIYMGCRKIKLLGMDHNYILYANTEDMRMYSNATHQDIEKTTVFSKENMTLEYLRQYKIFSKYQQIENLFPGRVENLTKGGLLHIFKRENFNEK